ncbi:accessory gene regulator B family protein [Lachnospiraceae bacterium JLR.KK009]|jgi:Membrane protein putatively involved in post-translational modification of the autoinducing quorum-sensing peptide
MVEYFSGKLVLWLLSTNVINESEKEIYEFGLFQLVANFIQFLLMIVIGLFMDELPAMIAYMVSFTNLRKYAGGYHAETIGKCFLTSMVIPFVFIFFLKISYFSVTIEIFIWIIANIIIILLAPIQSRNKPLDTSERKIFKRKALMVCFFEDLVILFCFTLCFWNIFDGFVFGQIIVTISLLTGRKILLDYNTNSNF